MWGSLVHNLTIETKRAVTCNFSADQWGLLTYSFPRDEIEEVANRLNNQLNEYVNEEYTMTEVRDGMHHYMLNCKNYGAYDTEPREFLECVLTEIYK
jgi:hypothetical protein